MTKLLNTYTKGTVACVADALNLLYIPVALCANQ